MDKFAPQAIKGPDLEILQPFHLFTSFAGGLIKVLDPFILLLFHTWLSSWFCDRRPEGSKVTLQPLGSRSWHSALWPQRLEITQAIMSGHWPHLNQRKSGASLYVWACHVRPSSQQINFRMKWVSLRCCVNFCMRELVCLTPKVKVLWREKNLTQTSSDSTPAGVQFCHMFTCLFR